jgi:histidine ammonia-lyase
MTPVVLDAHLTADVAAVAGGARVALDDVALRRVAANRAALERLLAEGTRVYAITTGFGLDCDAADAGEAVAAARAAVRARVAPLTEHRPPAPDVAALRPLVADGTPAPPLANATAGAGGAAPAPTPAGASPR